MRRLLSLQVGMPQTVGSADAEAPMDREWTSGIFKDPVSGRVEASEMGLEGDGQADLENHGGLDKAINVYASEHYPDWQADLQIPNLPNGAFGENMTVQGMLETEVCIGDIYEVDHVLVQVSQPRQPCWKLGRRWRIKDLPAQVIRNGKTGWYFRVLQPGQMGAGDELALLERPHPDWTVDAANQVMHHRKSDIEAAHKLAACAGLSEAWKEILGARGGNA